MSKHLFSLHVYMEETDAGGHVYHANYLKFAERARTEMLRQRGINQNSLHLNQNIFFVVRECKIDYLSPARLDDFLEVHTVLQEVTGARVVIDQKIVRGSVQIVNILITLVLVNDKGRPLRFPTFLREALVAIKTDLKSKD